jgi:hypothetical protein
VRSAVGGGGLTGPAAEGAGERCLVGEAGQEGNIGLAVHGRGEERLRSVAQPAHPLPSGARPLALGMYATGVICLVGSFAALLAPSMCTVIDPFYVIPLVVELTFAIGLLTRGLQTDTADPSQIVPVAA